MAVKKVVQYYSSGKKKIMNKGQWKIKIKKACLALGTYKPEFDMTIDSLAEIKVLRQTTMKQFKEDGGLAIIEHTNQGGSTNLAKHPAISLLIELYGQELSYQREMGLTAKGLRSLGMDVDEEQNTFEKMLSELGA